MGDTSAGMSSSSDTDPTTSPSTNQTPPLPARTSTPEGHRSPKMPGVLSRDSHEMSVEEKGYLQQIQAIEAKRLYNKERNKAMLAQFQAYVKEDEDHQSLLNDLRKQQEQAASKHRLLQEKRTKQQKQFQSYITDELITEMRVSAEADTELQTAIELIANNGGEKLHYQKLKNCFIDEVAGSEDHIWRFLALKLLQKNPTSLVLVKPLAEHDTPEKSQDNDKAKDAQPDKDHEPRSSDQLAQLPKPTDAVAQDNIATNETNRSLQQSDLAGDIGNSIDELDCFLSPPSPQQVADSIVVSTIELQPTTNESKAEESARIENEDNINQTPPSAKRRKLQDIESSPGTMQLRYSISAPLKDIENGLVTPVSDGSTTAARGRDSAVGSEIGSKRSRNDISVDSRLSKSSLSVAQTEQTAAANKKLLPAVKELKRRLDESARNGIDVLPELKCRKCNKTPRDPRVSSCSHVYCSKCLAQLRKEANDANDEVRCMACSLIIGKRANQVAGELIEEWKNEYAGDDGDNESDSCLDDIDVEELESVSTAAAHGEDDG